MKKQDSTLQSNTRTGSAPKQKRGYQPRYLAEPVNPPARKPKKKRSTGRNILLVVLIIIFLLNATGVGVYWGMMIREQRALSKLSSYTQLATQPPTTPSTAPTIHKETGDTLTEEPVETEPPEPTEPTILPQYAALYEQNPDFFGWIKIADTPIDFPVMYTPDNPEKYLHTNFEGAYSPAGLPFMDSDCTADSDNLILYGHNMTVGGMFRTLTKYADEDYWEEHPIIEFNTLYETQEFEILAAFYDRVYYKSEDVFKFYQFIDAEDEADFDNAISNYKAKRLYDTGVEATYGDQLITLVTCAYHTENGRFVVVARKIP